MVLVQIHQMPKADVEMFYRIASSPQKRKLKILHILDALRIQRGKHYLYSYFLLEKIYLLPKDASK